MGAFTSNGVDRMRWAEVGGWSVGGPMAERDVRWPNGAAVVNPVGIGLVGS